jgi:hypothetical protein
MPSAGPRGNEFSLWGAFGFDALVYLRIRVAPASTKPRRFSMMNRRSSIPIKPLRLVQDRAFNPYKSNNQADELWSGTHNL